MRMPKRKPANISSRVKRKLGLSVILALLFDLLYLYVSKYSRKNLSILEFNPWFMGNIINFLFFLIPAAGILWMMIHADKYEKRHFSVMFWLAILMNIPLIFQAAMSRMHLQLPPDYVFGYPFPKIFVAGVFALFQFILFMLTSAVWLGIFRHDRFLIFKSIVYSALLILLTVNSVLLYNSFYLDETQNYYASEEKSDVAVVLGAAVWSKDRPSPIFASRISKASNLYQSGAVDKIQVTGGNAPGERSEADVAFRYLRRIGVDARDIWIERKTASTADQVEFIKEKLVRQKKLRSIIIVSDKFHLKRVMEICKFYNVKASGVASDLSLSWEKSFIYRFRDSMALLIFWLFAL